MCIVSPEVWRLRLRLTSLAAQLEETLDAAEGQLNANITHYDRDRLCLGRLVTFVGPR
jgi:hypothetical protein